MNKWKIAFWVCLALLLISIGGNLFLGYGIIDQAVTHTYQKVSHTDTEDDLEQLVELINRTDLSKSEIIQVLEKHEFAEFMNFDSDTVELKRINIIFEDGKLAEITKRW